MTLDMRALRRVCVCVCVSTYAPVADGAQRLQVVQGALSSAAVDRPDVVHLPEVPLDRSADHLVQLETGPSFLKSPWKPWPT